MAKPQITVYESPLTGDRYNIYPVSPVLFSNINSATTETEQTRALRVRAVQIAQAMKTNEQIIAKLPATERKPVEDQIIKDGKELLDINVQLAAMTKATPETITTMLKTFVKECETMSDKDILHMGKDLDLLFVKIRQLADLDSEQYGDAVDNALGFFRGKRDASGKSSE